MQCEISTISQGEMTIAQYFTKLKKLWDELTCLMPVPVCSCNCKCGAIKKVIEMNEANHLLQLLMGLNEGYDVIRN